MYIWVGVTDPILVAYRFVPPPLEVKVWRTVV